jgi:hypothetical protein
MIIRSAKSTDIPFIQELYNSYEFKLDTRHIESLVIAEDTTGIIAVMSINTILECCFLTTRESSRKDRIAALIRLVEEGREEVKNLKYDGIHAFANKEIGPILKKHFGFVPGKDENLFLFVESRSN